MFVQDLELIDPVAGVKGNLCVKDIDKINDAVTVKWTSDNLVFYPNTNSTTLSGYVCLYQFHLAAL